MQWICIPFLSYVCRDIQSHFNFGEFGCEKSSYPKWQELSEGTRRILREPNCGGNSIVSEALSFEMFNRIFNAILLKVVLMVNSLHYFIIFHMFVRSTGLIKQRNCQNQLNWHKCIKTLCSYNVYSLFI